MTKNAAFFTTIFISLFFSMIFSACSAEMAPTEPCDEKIDNTKDYENIVLGNPVVQELNSELNLLRVDISHCFVDDKLSVGLLYQLPVSYSEYEIIYTDFLWLVYTKNGTLEISSRDSDQNQALEAKTVLGNLRQKINKIETAPQVIEILSKTEPAPPMYPAVEFPGQTQPAPQLFPSGSLVSGEISRDGGNRFQYSSASGEVIAYTLSNDVEWQAFPEIKLAHKIIQENLLVGSLSNCVISHNQLNSMTSMQTYDSAMYPKFMTVALVCNGDWQDALVRINSDGSYDGLELQYKPPDSHP